MSIVAVTSPNASVAHLSKGHCDQLEASNPPFNPALTRRQLLATTAGAVALAPAISSPSPSPALPLAPLGGVEHVGGPKLTGLPPQDIADILARNLRDGQYFVTGDLTPEIFDDACRFKDPTNDVTGLARYKKALGLLFDPSYSAVRLLDIAVTSPTTIEARWTLGGYLKFPWAPRVEPFEGQTIYRLGADGLIVEQDQTWSISPAEALRETFTPTAGPR